MRKISWGLVITITCSCAWAVNGDLGGGDGSQENPYLIQDINDFYEFCWDSAYWNDYTRLECDLDLSAAGTYTRAPIAGDPDTDITFDGTPFTGSFDGNNHVVSNLAIGGAYYLGLFGSIGSGAVVINLGVVDCSIVGGNNSHYLGGLCARNSGSVRNCYATGSVSGGNNSGWLAGLIGYNSGSISNCCAAGTVGGHEDTGGLCGYNSGGSISNSYAVAAVTGADQVGGLCGYLYSGSISKCYTAGNVQGTGYSVGALCGRKNYQGTVSNCYFYLFSGPDNNMGTILEESQVEADRFVGFDFAGDPNDGTDDYWTMVSGHCPKLTWQPGEGPLPPSPPAAALAGSGYSDDPFYINNDTDFMELSTNSDLVYGYYILTTDIDLGTETFTAAVVNRIFSGHFKGGSHIITNLTIDTEGANTDYLGLFAQLKGYTAEMNDLGIVDCTIIGGAGSDYLGSLCADASYGSRIRTCYSTGSVTGGSFVGGLIGANSSSIRDCFSAGSVSGAIGYIGGFCGDNGSTIDNCYAAGAIVGNDNAYRLGGFCGSNVGTISNCYATGDVTGGNDAYEVGGFCGQNTSTETIINCYAVGAMSSGDNAYNIGGFCGNNSYGAVTDCFWDMETGGPDNDIAIGKSTAQMQTLSTFTDAGWDFVGESVNGTEDIWSICETTNYPRLHWQIPAGDFLCPDGVALEDYSFFVQHWLETEYGTLEGAELTGDGWVGMDDFVALVDYWLLAGCGDCDGRDLTGEGDVDLADVGFMSRRWQQSDYGDCGRAELTGDGKVDLEDFTLFCHNWLTGVE